MVDQMRARSPNREAKKRYRRFGSGNWDSFKAKREKRKTDRQRRQIDVCTKRLGKEQRDVRNEEVCSASSTDRIIAFHSHIKLRTFFKKVLFDGVKETKWYQFSMIV